MCVCMSVSACVYVCVGGGKVKRCLKVQTKYFLTILILLSLTYSIVIVLIFEND